jgi:hypothetical protein
MKRLLARRALLAGVTFSIACAGMYTPAPAAAQWSTVYEQTYLPASHNWAFRRNYNAAERLFYAFDYGHAILYETLWTRPGAPASLLEEEIYNRLTRRILVRPPHVPLEEGAIEIAYAKLAPEAKVMFDWAHILHRQVYDVWADERIPVVQKDAHIDEILRYYRSRPDIAFSSVPKSMDVMDGQYYSLAFRERYPKFNGLIWAYHWLQIGLYEPLMAGTTPDERQSGVTATVARFWQMLEDAPNRMPRLMPMSAGVAPTFSARYPEIAVIFDNLHMMHDVISDILASTAVPRDRKRHEIMRAVDIFRDRTTQVITMDEWWMMGDMMGVENMGGAATPRLILTAVPEGTVPRGMSMAGMDHAQHDQARPPGQDPHAGHVMPGAPPSQPGHDAHAPPGARLAPADVQRLLAVHERMMADPVIRERVVTDPVLQRLLSELHAAPPVQHAPGDMTDMEMHQTMEFVVRLLSDPRIEARIHADPRLHQLWADPEVQRLMEMMRRMHGPGAPQPPRHEHRQPPPQRH